MPTIPAAVLVETPDTCGGRVRIDGTRITVHLIALLYNQGLSAEEVVAEYPQLELAQVYTALAYYHTHRAQIDADLAADDAEYDRLKSSTNADVR